jgi:phosphoglucomutase
MALSPSAGTPVPADHLADVNALLKAYLQERPDPARPAERVSFGTSGHRGSSLRAGSGCRRPPPVTSCSIRRP